MRPNLRSLHASQHRLHDKDSRAEMKLRQIVQILLFHVGEKIWPNDAGVMDYGADGKSFGDVCGGSFGGARIDQINLNRVKQLMRPVRRPARQRHDLITGIKHLPTNRSANAGTTAGDNGDRAFAHFESHMKSWMLRKAASQLTRSTRFNLIFNSPPIVASVWVAHAA